MVVRIQAQAVMTRTCKKKNSFKANLFISIHFNAGGGYEDFIYTSVPTKITEMQKVLHKIILGKIAKYRMVDRGMKRANFSVLRKTSMDAILLEAGFCDSKDATVLKSNEYQRDFCLGILAGVKQIFQNS